MTTKIAAVITALTIAALFAVTGCQKQEGQKQGGEAPSSAPSSTQTTTSPGSK